MMRGLIRESSFGLVLPDSMTAEWSHDNRNRKLGALIWKTNTKQTEGQITNWESWKDFLPQARPRSLQTVLPAGHQVFTYRSPWRTFLFKGLRGWGWIKSVLNLIS